MYYRFLLNSHMNKTKLIFENLNHNEYGKDDIKINKQTKVNNRGDLLSGK